MATGFKCVLDRTEIIENCKLSMLVIPCSVEALLSSFVLCGEVVLSVGGLIHTNISILILQGSKFFVHVEVIRCTCKTDVCLWICLLRMYTSCHHTVAVRLSM